MTDRIRKTTLALLAAAALGAPGAAAESPDGYVTAFSCEPMQRPLSVTPQILDNTDENVRLHGILVERLAERGVTVDDAAGQTMSFNVERVREAAVRKPGDLVDVRVGQEDPDDLGREGFASVHMNIWSNSRDSVIGGRRDTVEHRLVDRLHISVTINSKADGRCLWRGEVVQNLDGRDPGRTAEQMIPILTRAIGKSLSQQPITLD